MEAKSREHRQRRRDDFMIFEGCQGKPRTPTLEEKRCPRCGNLIEIFSADTEAVCENRRCKEAGNLSYGMW